jgi:hypothetical protein
MSDEDCLPTYVGGIFGRDRRRRRRMSEGRRPQLERVTMRKRAAGGEKERKGLQKPVWCEIQEPEVSE